MKDMIQRMTDLESNTTQQLTEDVNEGCGDMPMNPPMDQGNPVSMNVSLSASGKDHVSDLIDMMKNAGMNAAAPVSQDMMPMRTDIERLRGIVDGPEMETIEEDDDPEMMDKLQKIADGPDGEDELLMRMNTGRGEEGMYLRKTYDKISNKMFSKDSGDLEDPEDFDKVHAAVMQMFGIEAEPLASLQQKAKDREISGALNDPELTGEMEGYDNEPEPEYRDQQFMTKDISGGLNKEKKAYPAAQDGDNAMAAKIKEQLMSALSEKKSKPDYIDIDGDGDKKEPMKKAAKDAKSKKKVGEEKQKGVDGKACWDGYKRMGTKKKGGKTVDNCVKIKK